MKANTKVPGRKRAFMHRTVVTGSCVVLSSVVAIFVFLESSAPTSVDRLPSVAEVAVDRDGVPEEELRVDVIGGRLLLLDETKDKTNVQGAQKKVHLISVVIWGVDVEGQETLAASGRAWMHTRHTGEQVLGVENGRFSFEVDPSDKLLRINRLVLDRKLAKPMRDEYELSAQGEVVIHAMIERPVTLRVIDEISGDPMRNVTLLSSVTRPIGIYDRRPERTRSVVEGADSPITLTLCRDVSNTRWNERVNVRVPGYADRTADLDFAAGGEVTIALRRGAELEVAVVASDEGRENRLCQGRNGRGLWLQVLEFDATRSNYRENDLGPGHRVIEETPSERPIFEVEIPSNLKIFASGLSSGRRLLRVVKGESGTPRILMGETSVDLVAGRCTWSSISLSIPSYVSKVSLEGVVLLPLSWETQTLFLSLYALDPEFLLDANDESIKNIKLKRDDQAGDRLPFKFPAISPGLYSCVLRSLPEKIVVDTGWRGRSDLEISVEEPAFVCVYFRDAVTGELMDDPIGLDWVHFHESVGGRCQSCNGGGTRGGGTPRTWWFRCPAGEAGLYLTEGLVPLVQRLVPDHIRVDPGVNVFTFYLRRQVSVHLKVASAAGDVPLSEDVALSLWMESDAICAQVRPVIRYGEAVFSLPGGGEWRVGINRWCGYKVVEPEVIRVVAGERIDRIVYVRTL